MCSRGLSCGGSSIPGGGAAGGMHRTSTSALPYPQSGTAQSVTILPCAMLRALHMRYLTSSSWFSRWEASIDFRAKCQYDMRTCVYTFHLCSSVGIKECTDDVPSMEMEGMITHEISHTSPCDDICCLNADSRQLQRFDHDIEQLGFNV